MLKTASRASALRRIRPTSLVSPMLRLMSGRKIVDVEGLRIFVDPTSHLGHEILSTRTYEPETIRLFREHLKPGHTMLDLGANEGFFSAMAADIVGETGLVIAVEPQSRLADVLEINLALNARGPTRIVNRLIDEKDDEVLQITLFPISNTGASSVVRKYRFGARTENVKSITPATIFRQAGIDHVDFVKIDVEGFEPEVMRSMAPLLDQRKVGAILLDYHRAILDARGIDPKVTHDAILAAGYGVVEGDVGGGYVLYRLS